MEELRSEKGPFGRAADLKEGDIDSEKVAMVWSRAATQVGKCDRMLDAF